MHRFLARQWILARRAAQKQAAGVRDKVKNLRPQGSDDPSIMEGISLFARSAQAATSQRAERVWRNMGDLRSALERELDARLRALGEDLSKIAPAQVKQVMEVAERLRTTVQKKAADDASPVPPVPVGEPIVEKDPPAPSSDQHAKKSPTGGGTRGGFIDGRSMLQQVRDVLDREMKRVSTMNIPYADKLRLDAIRARLDALQRVAELNTSSIVGRMRQGDEAMRNLLQIVKLSEGIQTLGKMQEYALGAGKNLNKALSEAVDTVKLKVDAHPLKQGVHFVPHYLLYRFDDVGIPLRKPRPKVAVTRKPKKPILLIPGIGGSLLRARRDGSDPLEEMDVYFRFWKADAIFKEYLHGTFDRARQLYVSDKPGWTVHVPDDRFGLRSLEFLNYIEGSGAPTVPYYRVFIERLKRLGYVEGETLFGHPYDFRQAAYSRHLLNALHGKIEKIYAATGQPVDVVAHSYGGVLMRAYLHFFPEAAEMVSSFIAVSVPFQGSEGKGLMSAISGYNFDIPNINPASVQQAVITSPTLYELLPTEGFPYHHPPAVIVKHNGVERAYGHPDWIKVCQEATRNDGPRAWQHDLYRHSQHLRHQIHRRGPPQRAKPLPFLNIHGVDVPTPVTLRYTQKDVKDLAELKAMEPTHDYVSGDYVVGYESARADHMGTGPHVVRRSFPGINHVEAIYHKETFAAVADFLRNHTHSI